MVPPYSIITPVPGWRNRFPWLRAGTTRRPPDPSVRQGGLAGRLDVRRWRSVVRSRQVHGSRILVHTDVPRGEVLVGDGDGHATRATDLLLAVSLADCVPVFVVDPERKVVALLHAGWRGTAAGVVESGVAVLERAFRSTPGDLFVHLGPAICGSCYEVGPEVFAAVGESTPRGPALLDLRRVVCQRVVDSGVERNRVSVSPECTLCGGKRYFSHRRGDRGRHFAFMGILAGAG